MKIKIQKKNGHKIADLNRRKAVRERCLNCSAWIPKEVSNCEFTDCQLYPFRSGRGKQNVKERTKAIRSYCLWCMVGKRSEVVKCVCPDCSLFPYRLGKVDRSTEIKSIKKNEHIEAVSVYKNEKEYQNMAN